MEEWQSGFRRTRDLEDIPVQESSDSIQSALARHYEWTPEEAARFNNWIEDTRFVETEQFGLDWKGKKNKKSTAMGPFQILNQEGPGQTSFQTGLNRLGTAYRGLVGEAPDWVSDLYEEGSPEDMNYEQHKDWLLGNIWSQIKGSDETRELFTAVARGDLAARLRLYKLHHSMGGTKKNREKAFKRASRLYRSRQEERDEERNTEYRGGGLIRDIYGRTLI